MGVITILRDLWRFRGTVALVAVIALAIGILMTYEVSPPFSVKSRQYQIGIASARALVDTPSSQVVDLGGNTGADIRTLSARANLLASLMTSSPIKDEIARRAGVPIELLVTPATAAGAAVPGAPKDVSGAAVTADDPRAYVLKSSVPTLPSGEVPIVAVDTQAPDAASAAKLADEAISVLRAHLENVAGTESVPARRRVTLRELGTARSATETRGPSRFVALLATLFAFGAGCGVLLGGARLVRGWRDASDLEAHPPEDRVAPVEEPDDDAHDDVVEEEEEEVPAEPVAAAPRRARRTAAARNGSGPAEDVPMPVPVPSWLDDRPDEA